MNNEIEIVALPKDKWKGTPIPLVTKSDSYTNNDIGRREVRINLGFFFHRNSRL